MPWDVMGSLSQRLILCIFGSVCGVSRWRAMGIATVVAHKSGSEVWRLDIGSEAGERVWFEWILGVKGLLPYTPLSAEEGKTEGIIHSQGRPGPPSLLAFHILWVLHSSTIPHLLSLSPSQSRQGYKLARSAALVRAPCSS